MLPAVRLAVGRTLLGRRSCSQHTHTRHRAPQIAHISLLVKEHVTGRARPLELLQVEADNISAQVITPLTTAFADCKHISDIPFITIPVTIDSPLNAAFHLFITRPKSQPFCGLQNNTMV